ncbi:MAG: PEP-CTERM sorting domain-containing protein [Verrucomicrobiae bacterium]|nr:PEP-CTERM sorting domain-containing protein [Verrucomicrobiae bacterium]
MNSNPAKFACALFLLATAITATAQSTWNYFISDAGGGNSLVTWNVTGSFNTTPGEFLLNLQPRIHINDTPVIVSLDAPGIYNDSYVASGTLQSIPTPDGSLFLVLGGDIYAPIYGFETFNASGANNDTFALAATPVPVPGSDINYVYQPGTQSVLIPVDYSSFNPGTYQSVDAAYSPTLTVNLTIGPVPEPSTLALSGLGGLAGCLLFRRRHA